MTLVLQLLKVKVKNILNIGKVLTTYMYGHL